MLITVHSSISLVHNFVFNYMCVYDICTILQVHCPSGTIVKLLFVFPTLYLYEIHCTTIIHVYYINVYVHVYAELEFRMFIVRGI